MEKYCRFLENVKYGDEIIWEKNKEYLITHEDENNFYFGNPVLNGIAKSYKNELFKIVSIE